MAHADWICKGGDIVSMDVNNPVVEAVPVRGGRIEQVGPMAAIQPSMGPVTGVLRQDSNFKAKKVATDLISDEKRKEALKIAADAAARKGVTTINAMEGG